MPAYYNEIDPYAAQWLRNLIAAGHIAPGDVDTRDIREVNADDLSGYTQCHFFAGIGGWALALRMAGWPDARPVWTGSCPCQPFSAAGKKTRQSDERHLWPAWHRLIRESKPAVVFGEQVASAVTAGWLDDVAADLETEGYAVAAAVLPACAAGAFHRRDRLWFVANANGGRGRADTAGGNQLHRNDAGRQETHRLLGTTGEDAVAHAEGISGGTGLCKAGTQQYRNEPAHGGGAGGVVENAESNGRREGRTESERQQRGFSAASAGTSCGALDDATRAGKWGEIGNFHQAHGGPLGELLQQPYSAGESNMGHPQRAGLEGQPGHDENSRGGQSEDGSAAETDSGISWIECPDGKVRPVKPGLCLLAHGVPARMGRLRAYGNAIVPQVAAEFIKAAAECVA